MRESLKLATGSERKKLFASGKLRIADIAARTEERGGFVKEFLVFRGAPATRINAPKVKLLERQMKDFCHGTASDFWTNLIGRSRRFALNGRMAHVSAKKLERLGHSWFSQSENGPKNRPAICKHRR